MKIRKLLALTLAGIAATALLLTGCDSGNQGGGNEGGTDNTQQGSGKLETYTFEAEYIDIDDVQGAGISSDQGGVEMIYGQGTDAEKEKWSNGYFVGYTYATNLELTFEFESDKDAKATIVLRLGSELGTLSLSPSTFSVKLNGTEINYGSLSVENSKDYEEMKFYDKTVSTSADLKAGKNTVTLKILANDFRNGQTGGPTIDCLKVTTTATLTWDPKTDNPSRKGGSIF